MPWVGAEQNSDFGPAEAEPVTEMIGSDTIRARTEGLESELTLTPRYVHFTKGISDLKHILRQYKGTQRL